MWNPGASHLAELAVLLGFGLLLRLVAIGRSDTDQWANRAMIERQRPRRWIRYDLPDSLIPGTFPYPQLVHFLASRTPPAFSSAAAFAMTVLPDVALAAAVQLGVFRWLTGRGLAPDRAARFAFGAALVFLTLPGLIAVSSRMRAANGRAPGLLLATASLGCTAAALASGAALWLAPGALLAGLTVLTSQFATQALVFFSPLLALAYGSGLPLVPIAAALAVGWCVPALGIRDLLIHKANHMLWYAENRERATTATGRNLLRNALALPRALLTDRPRAVDLLLRRSPLLIAAWAVPPLWVLLWMLFQPGVLGQALADPALRFCLATVACSAVVFLLTSTGRLTILGEAERYFDYSAPMLCAAVAAIGASQGLLSPHAFVVLAAAQGCVLAAVQLLADPSFAERMRFGLTRSREVEEVARFLEGLGPVRAATVPIKLPDLLSVHTGVRGDPPVKYYYRCLLSPDKRIDAFRYFTEDIEELDYFRGTPKALAERYAIDTIVADRRYLAKRDTEFGRALEAMEPVFSNLKYAVYRL